MSESPPKRSKNHLHQRTTARRQSPQPPPSESSPMRQLPQRCDEHHEQIHFCCFDCDAVVCCSKCIAVGRHRSHDIKNLHRSYVLVEANLNEMLVKLAARVDLYSLSHQKLSVSRSELIEDYAQVRNRVEKEFRYVQQLLTQRCVDITNSIEQQCKAKEEELNRILTEVRTQIKLCMDCHTDIDESIKVLGEVALCTYYSETKGEVEELLTVQIQDRIPHRVQISVQLNKLNQLAEYVRELRVPCVSVSQRKRTVNIRGSVDLHKRFVSHSPIQPLVDRNPRQSFPISPTLSQNPPDQPAPLRPKSKDLLLLYNSRRSPKMFSMPSSPPNEKQSPLHQYLQIQKKSFNLGRKHC